MLEQHDERAGSRRDITVEKLTAMCNDPHAVIAAQRRRAAGFAQAGGS